MPGRLHRKKHNFSIIDNSGAEDVNLSFKARGLLWYLLTKPDGWEVRMSDLIAKSGNVTGKDGKVKNKGREYVQNAVKELEEAGYMIRWCDRNECGQIQWHTEFFECLDDANEWREENVDKVEQSQKFKRNPSTATGITVDGFSVNGSTDDGKAVHIVNTDQVNNKKKESVFLSQKRIEEEVPTPEVHPETNGNPPPTPSRAATYQHPTEKVESRFRSQTVIPREYGNLLNSGYEFIWVGPGLNDFHPDLIEAVTAYKKKLEQPHDLAAAKQYIRNRIYNAQWGDIAARLEERESLKAPVVSVEGVSKSVVWYEHPAHAPLWNQYKSLAESVGVTLTPERVGFFYLYQEPECEVRRWKFTPESVARHMRRLQEKLNHAAA